MESLEATDLAQISEVHVLYVYSACLLCFR
jgi:hypothetical protein